MTQIPHPPRLNTSESDAPESLRAALRAAASDKPSERDLQELRGVLGPILAAPPAASLGGPVAATGLAKGASLAFAKVWWLVVACAVGAGGVGAWRLSRTSADVPAPAPASPPAQAAPAVVEPAPTNRAEETPPVPAPPPARESVRARPSEPGVAAPTPTSEAKPSEPAAAPSELSLLEQARRSATTDPGRSLGLVGEMRRQFPQGAFSEERDFLEIEAMKRLGRQSEARALEERFYARYPNSMHGRTLRVQPK